MQFTTDPIKIFETFSNALFKVVLSLSPSGSLVAMPGYASSHNFRKGGHLQYVSVTSLLTTNVSVETKS